MTMNQTSVNKEIHQKSDHFTTMFKKFHTAFTQKELCDVTLISDDKTSIPAHRLVLSSASDYFAAMFRVPLKEAKEEEIPLHGIPGDVLHSLLLFCYTGAIEINTDNVECILRFAIMYQFPDVVKKCSGFLSDQLQPSNSLGVALLADQLSLQELAQSAWSYTCANFLDVNQNDEFMELSHTDLTKLLSSEDLTVNEEEDVFNCVEAWVKHNSPERIKYIVSLLPHIRLPLINQRFLSERVLPFFNQIPCKDDLIKCQQLLNNALLPPKTPSQIVIARKSCPTRLLLIGDLNIFEIFDPLKDHWNKLKLDALPFNKTRLSWSSFAIMDNKLLIIGSHDGRNTASRVECIDFNKMTSILLPPLNECRYYSSAAVVNGIVYCIGGSGYNEAKSTVERYDRNTCKWENVAPMNVARRSAAVSVIENEIYIVGGHTGNGPTSSMECYDTKTDIWRNCVPMRQSYSRIAAGAINGFIYVIGSNNLRLQKANTLAVERYDPVLNKWEQLANLKKVFCYWSAAVLGNRFIVASCSDRSLKNVQQYNPDENKWTTLTNFNAGSTNLKIIPVSEKFVNNINKSVM